MKLPLITSIALVAIMIAVWEGVTFYRSLNYWKPAESEIPSPKTAHSPVLDLSLPDLEQHPQPLRQWQGRVIVVNFWAAWCEPCKDEMPMLNRVQAAWPADQVRFVGIGIDEREALQAYLKQQPMNYPMLVGSQDALNLTRAYGNTQMGIPFTLICDSSGKVVFEKLGRVQESELRAAILTAIHAQQS